MTDATTAPYFAYGSNMCREVMAKIAPRAKVLDAGRLDGHRLAFTRRSVVWHAGVAGIPEFPGFSVYGVLRPALWRALGARALFYGLTVLLGIGAVFQILQAFVPHWGSHVDALAALVLSLVITVGLSVVDLRSRFRY